MKISFKYKLFFAFIFYGLCLVLFALFAIFKINKMSVKAVSVKKASETFVERNKVFKTYIKDIKLKIISIENSNIFNKYLSNPVDDSLVRSLFVDIAGTSDNIMQLRYIDSTGKEKVRIDRDEFASKPYIIKKKNLQDKSNRYYFIDIMNTPKDEFWYSKLDLNIEYGKIEKPIKPVLRIGSPIFHNGKKIGILIINIFMKNFLQSLVNIPLHDVYLFDGDGDILVDSIHNKCWGKYLDNNETIFTIFNKKADLFFSKGEYFGENFYSNKIFLKNDENIHMIVKPKKIHIQKVLDKHLYEFGWIVFSVIVLSFPIAYFFSRTPAKLKEQVDKQKNEQDILLSLFDLGDAVLFKWNNDDKWSVEYVSKSVEELLGYTQNDFQTDLISYTNCVHHDDLMKVTQEITSAVEDELYFFEHKPYRVITKNGDVKWILDSTVVVRDVNNKIVNFVGYLIDITELKDNEKHLLAQSRLAQMVEMISMIAHQWRQPLTIIAMQANNMKMDIELDEVNEDSLKSAIEDILRHTQYLSKTIDDFRNFYKPNNKSVNIKLEDMISKSLKIIKSSLVNDNIEIIEEYNSSQVIELYENEMMQVILNLLRNAQDKFKEKLIEKPYIKITTQNTKIIICDNAGGISEDIIEKIFDPYFSTKDEKNGTGLGLHLSKTIVEEHHNGTLSVSNTFNGVCFIIELG